MVAIKIIALMIVGVLSIFGLIGSKVVDVNLSKIPIISSLVQEQKPVNPNIQFNETFGVNTDTTKPFDIGKWATSIPLKDVADYMWSGVSGILHWLTEGLTNIAAFIIRLVKPDANVPQFIGPLVFILILLLFGYLGWSALWDLGMRGIIIGLILSFVIFAVAIALILLRLI